MAHWSFPFDLGLYASWHKIVGKQMLPTFIAVGAAKAGTTSLYSYLDSHPSIYMSPMKEPHFFSFVGEQPRFSGPHDRQTNERDIVFRKHDYEALFDGHEEEAAIGECSNSYLYFSRAASRIKDMIPKCKIIVMIRNPIERTFSHYRQAAAIGHECLSFEDALDAEETRNDAGWRWHYQYKGQSLYSRQIENYLKMFGVENVKVIRFRQLQKELPAMMADVYGFLGVDAAFEGYDAEIHNQTALPRSRHLQKLLREGGIPRSVAKRVLPSQIRKRMGVVLSKANVGQPYHPDMKEETRRKLSDYFADDILRLQTLLSTDFSDWLAPESR